MISGRALDEDPVDPCRTRFAPSPTGSLHVGGARTALYCLLWARRTGGRFILRIEDTDRVRSDEEASRGILRDLRWLGLHWDEGPEVGGEVGPYYQSQRRDIYDRHVERLLSEGRAYEAWDTREELDALREQARRDKRTFVYRPRAWTDDEIARFRAQGRTPVVRLRAPDHPITVRDRILGEVTLQPDELDDIVIRKADGWPTYHFAVVVDDHLMGIDLVLRGQEHLKNTHKQHGIFEALGWPPIDTAHVPLIFSPDGAKMSKRDKAKAARKAAREAAKRLDHGGWGWLAERCGRTEAEVERFMKKKTDDVATATDIAAALGAALPMIEVMDFRRAGYVPEALLNYLALLGWSPGDDRELMSLDEMIEVFSIDRIGHTAARFDPNKLRWMNAEYLRHRLDDERLLACFAAWFEVVSTPLAELDPDRLLALFAMYRPRVHTFAELDRAARFFFERPEDYDPKAVEKHLVRGRGVDRLPLLRAALADVGRWEADSLERALSALVEQTGCGLGKFAQPLRIALSGGAVTPSIYDVLVFLGRDETLARLDAAIAHFGAVG